MVLEPFVKDWSVIGVTEDLLLTGASLQHDSHALGTLRAVCRES